MHVKKGDRVTVIAGNDKGQEGEVLEVLLDKDRVLVSGVNVRTKHQKPSQQNPQGERIEREFSIHASNVMRIDPETGKPTRKRAPKANKD